MPPLETHFRLEIEFHRRLRTQAPGTADARALHTSLQFGYEPLLRALGTATAQDIEQLRNRLTLAADARDILAARDSLKQLQGIPAVAP